LQNGRALMFSNFFPRWRINPHTLITLLLCLWLFFPTVLFATETTASFNTEIRQHPVIRYGAETDWSPFDFVTPDGKHTGLSYDFLQAISKYSGLTFQPKISSWTQLLKDIQSGEIDLLPTIYRTDERDSYLLFTHPYQQTLAYFFIHKSVPIKTEYDLKGHTIAIPKGYAQITDVKKQFPKLKILETNSLMASVQAVIERKADILLETYAVMDYLLKQNSLTSIRPLMPLPPGEAKKMFMAVRKDSPLLLSILNKSLAAIPENEKQAINTKWLGYQESQGSQEDIELSSAEKHWLSQHPVIRFTGDPHWLPHEAFDAQGHYIGMVAEHLKLLEKKLPIKFDIIQTHSWDESIAKIKSGAVDMLSETVDSDLRSQLIFTQAYLSSPVVIVMRNDEDYVDSIDTLKQRRLAVVKDYGYNPAIFKAYPTIKFIEVESVPAGLLAVSTGEIDALFCTLAQASYQIATEGINNIRIVGKTEFMTQLGFGVRKEFAPLVPLLNRALNSINEREKQQISDLWGKDRFAAKTDYHLISQIVVVFLVLLIMVFLWIRRLTQEIARRKHSEQQVMLLNHRFALASSVASIGIWEVELQPEIPVNFEEKIYETYGMREQAQFSQLVQREIPLKEWLQQAHSDDHDLIEYALTTLKDEGGSDLQFEYRVLRSDNTFCNIYCASYATKTEGKPTKIIGVTWDITQRKQIESALEKAKTQAENANLAKSQFLANMSHEIRTPLNAIIGFTDLLCEQTKDPKLTTFVKTIQNAGHNLLVLINDILDLSKIEAGKMRIDKKMCNPHELFTELGQIFMMKMKERNLDFILNIDPQIPQNLLLDATRLRQILLNLIGNAVKFTEQGQICLRARTGNEDRMRSKLDLYIDVADSGIGISEDQQAIIFQDFEQLEGQDVRKYGGTGLGLAISKRLTEMMGGNISLVSQLGSGSTFTLHLKDVDVSTLTLEAAPTVQELPVKFLPATVLVVDDIADNRDLLKECFADMPLQIVEVENGLQAVENVQSAKFDVVLMDIRMPVMNGYQAAEKIKAFSNVPIIALTASVMQDEYERTKSAHFDGYLRKPIMKADLFKELKRFLPFESFQETVQSVDLMLTTEILHVVPEALCELEKLLITCEQISKNNNISKISLFANTLLSLGQQYNIDIVTDYAKQLLTQIDCFDIVAIKQLLNGYPQLLTQLSVA
jgi:two-component system sensor histidine kinase EvgS